jgi:DNA polymerase sigma
MHPKVARKSIDPLGNLGVLLMDMFQLYGINFNIDGVGIDVRGKGSYYLKVKYLYIIHLVKMASLRKKNPPSPK